MSVRVTSAVSRMRPRGRVSAGAYSAMIVFFLMQVLTGYGIPVPDPADDALPALVGLIVAALFPEKYVHFEMDFPIDDEV